MVSFSDSFMLTEDNLSSMNSMLHRYKDVELGKKRQIRDEAMEQVRAVQHLEDRQKQILDLEKKVVWADVQAIEDDIAGRESEISQIDQTMEKIQSARDATAKELEAVLSESAAVDEQVQAVKNDLTIYMGEVQRITRELDEILAPVDEAKMKVERNKGRIAACERDIRTLRGSIAAVTEQMQKKENDTRKKQQVEALQQALNALASRSSVLDEEIQRVVSARDELQRAQQDVNQEQKEVLSAMRERKYELARLKTQCADLEGSSSGSHRKYGQNVQSMFAELQQYRPQQPVFFPIGDYVTVKREYAEWASTIECYLSNVLSGAICCRGCSRDINKVRELMRRHGVGFACLVTVDYQGSQVLDPTRLPREGPTMLDVLEFKSEVVKKALIIQNHIEARLLVEDYTAVTRLTGDGAHRHMVQFVSSIVTRNGDNHRVINGKPISEANRRTPTGVLQSDVSGLLRDLRARVQEKEAEVAAADNEAQRLAREAGAKRDGVARNNQELQRKEAEKTSVSRLMSDKRRALDVLLGEDDAEELAELRGQQQTLEQTLGEKEEERQKYAEETAGLEEMVVAQESLVKGANERRGAMLKKVEETKERIRELKMKEDVTTTKARLEAKLQKSDEALAGLAKDRAKKEAETEKQKKTLGESLAALSAETRPAERVNKKQCQAMIAKCKEDLNVELEKLGIRDLEALKQAAAEKAAAYQKCNEEYKSIKREGQEMDRLDKRQKLTYNELRNEAQQQICKRFTKFLSQRKAEGKVDIDHGKKQVALSVKMDSTNEIASSQVSNIRVLSGGEKSFVTLSLIMATTHVIESPFFIMDEFDVFMDEANRVVSLHTIIDTARQEGRQFIFITPHNLETVVKEMNKDKEHSSIGIYALSDHQQGRAH